MRVVTESNYAKKALRVVLGEAVSVRVVRGRGKHDVIRKVCNCEADAGLIDADPHEEEPSDLKHFSTAAQHPQDEPEIIKKVYIFKQERKKVLVVVAPNFREYIAHMLTRRYERGPSDFNLPQEPNELKEALTGRSRNAHAKLCECAEWLRQQQAQEIAAIADWLKQDC